jgi:acetyl esterase/lipase
MTDYFAPRNSMKPMTVCLMMIAALFGGVRLRAEDLQNPPELPLWKSDQISPKPDPASPEKVLPRASNGQFVSNVTNPTVTVFPAPGDKVPHTAVIICPGGGYGGLALDWEGFDVAHWLNSIGVTGIVLKYRMPQPAITKDGKPLPLIDAQQAIRMARYHAKEWNIDPNKLGMMGFSAGGHLASTLGTHFEFRDNDSGRQQINDRPDFLILVYPVITFTPIGHSGSKQNLLGKNPDPATVDLYSNEKQVTEKTPPTFLTHAEDDPVKCENSLLFFEALRTHKVPCELRLFATGGHGFGLGQKGGEPAAWPKECQAWLVKQKLISESP